MMSEIKKYKKPNVFFVGAPKSGTTAMTKYLSTHPNICVSRPKEPYFFTQKLAESRFRSEKDYIKKCFYHWRQEDILINGNIKALQADGAMERIIDFNPKARFLIMLRNPVDAAYSLYSMLKSRFKEKADSFKTAWRRDVGQIEDNVPPEKSEAMNYKQAFLYGEQIEELLSLVSKDRIKIVLFRDFKKNPKKAYIEFLDYLDLSHEFNTDFPKVNEDIRFRSKVFKKIIDGLGELKETLGIPYLHLGIFSRIYSLNSRKYERGALDNDLRNEIRQHFTEDAQKLKKLTGIDILEKDK